MLQILLILKKIVPVRALQKLRSAYHFLLALCGAMWYRFPSRHLKVIGVTGTKGKTTTVELIRTVLNEAGFKAASLSSLQFVVGDTIQPNNLKMTMPGRFFIQRFLRDAVSKKCTHAVIEVTSEGIKQFRHRFIHFSTAVMTNITPEHIESHGTFEKYLRAKLDLFWRLSKTSTAVINMDDSLHERVSAASAAHQIYYGKNGITHETKHYRIRATSFTQKGTEFDLEHNTISSPLVGEFNYYNILAASAAAISQHVSLPHISSGIAKVAQIPGRLEFIQKEPFSVVIDYAHTPDSLKKVYTVLKQRQHASSPRSKLICVLGAAGGGRDKWKRPEFGKIAAEYCDTIFLTNEDPYDEDPLRILLEIASGIPVAANANVTKILDRRDAILQALKSAKKADIVVLTGKGSEHWIMGLQGKKIPWDEKSVAQECITLLATK